MFTESKPDLFFATVHNYKEEPTYDRLHWDGVELEGSNDLLFITQPIITEEELKEHTDNWEKPSPIALSYGYQKGSNYGNYENYENANYTNDFETPKPIIYKTTTHNGVSSKTCFKLSSTNGNDITLIGHICPDCQVLQIFTFYEHRTCDSYSCTICTEEQELPRVIEQEPACSKQLQLEQLEYSRLI